jgi:translocation and assembly module TamB
VRLRGRLVGGRLTLGAVDRLLPKPTGAPFRLPDLRVGLSDARLALATGAGTLTLRVDGQGNLANGFAGRYMAAAPQLDLSGCALAGLRLQGRVTTRELRPSFAGPLSARRLDCGDADAAAIAGTLDATLEPGLDGWRGAAGLASGDVRAAGWTAEGARTQVEFAGDSARTAGAIRLAGLSLAGPQGRAARAELGGRYTIESARPERLDEAAAPRAASIRFEGGLTGTGVALAAAPRLDGFARRVVGTPLAPLAEALARAADGIGQDAQLRASVSLATRGGEGALRIGSADLAGGGATLRFAGDEGVRLTWPGSGQVQVDGRLVLSGERVPEIVADLRQPAPGAPISGIARMAPYEAQGTRVVLAPVRFEADRFSTRAELSGPLLGGRVEGAALALEGRIGADGLVVNPRCTPLIFRDLTVSGLDLEPATLRLCPAGPALVANGRVAGAIEGPRLRGTLGSSPITLAATRARFDGQGFRMSDLAVRLGGADRVSRLDVASLSGTPANGVAGRFSGVSGQIGKVPLVVTGAAGRWRYAGGVLNLGGDLTLSDEPDPARFNPLISRDFALRLRGQDLVATGTLQEPQSGAEVAEVALRHHLGRGIGSADLAVDGVRFAREGLQPERITRLVLGVVADVDGTLAGQGRIDWGPERLTSTGRFRIEAASLAAPFGLATGVSTEIRFIDLLGLETAPGQTLTVATINPGILVENGVVSYRIEPGLKLAVEDARWPFAGGELSLRPTILDFSEDAARRLTFEITGLDAARFINKLEFSNINATGTFDGTLPMVFDQEGGRIVGGTLASRDPGGTVAYVGQVSNANLGIWGGIAFDALKSIAYERMTIELNGDLDGEMVSNIRFAGVSRGTIQPVATGLIARIGGQLAGELQRLPFIFNIQIRAPFRGLIAMARSFDDPSLLIQDQLGPQFQAVQPSSSEEKR